jgi:hypothetical protein
MSNPVTPMAVLGGVSYANNWYNEERMGNAASAAFDVKPLLFAGIGALFLSALGAIPGWEPVATAIGWLSVVGFILTPVQNPSPIDNLLAITGQKPQVLSPVKTH